MSDFDIRETNFEREGKTLFARLYLPEDAQEGKRVPMVIIAHGLNGTADRCDAYAREIAKRGYSACCFDFCGTPESRSDAGDKPMTIFTEQTDLEDVFDEISQLPFVDRNNIFLMGMSLGGAVASMVATHKGGLIKGLILLYPAFSVPGDLKRAFPETEELSESPTVFGEPISREFVESARDFDFYAIIVGYAGPVLIMHGMSDEIVASGYSVRAVNTYRNANLELIGEVGHGFEGGTFKYAVKKIVGFLDEEADLPDESGLNGDLNFSGGMGGMFG